MTTVKRSTVALVTGAGAGIGRACALALAECGFTVIATDIDESTASATRELVSDDVESESFQLDVTDERRWTEVVAQVHEKHGGIEVLVNNAGLKAPLAPGDRGLLDMDLETFDRMIAINLRGPMLGARAVLAGMLNRGKGSIIMLSSVVSLHSTPHLGTGYSCAKAAISGLTRSIAVTYGAMGVRCNAIAPGLVIVDEQDAAPREFKQSTLGLPLRPGRPPDIGRVVAFLASEASDYVNGQVIVVDGGLTAHLPGVRTSTPSSG